MINMPKEIATTLRKRLMPASASNSRTSLTITIMIVTVNAPSNRPSLVDVGFVWFSIRYALVDHIKGAT
jgi:hypothetical protein